MDKHLLAVMAETIQRKIRAITDVRMKEFIAVGCSLNGVVVNKIIDQSLEYSDSITLAYEVFGANGKCIRRYENCSLIIDYEVE